jgi:hypothetical protein
LLRQRASTAAGGSLCDASPTGTVSSIANRNGNKLCGRSLAVRLVRVAIMPQPISTPTAAGMIAPLVGITEPTVAPLP